jgi:hypothetical protein
MGLGLGKLPSNHGKLWCGIAGEPDCVASEQGLPIGHETLEMPPFRAHLVELARLAVCRCAKLGRPLLAGASSEPRPLRDSRYAKREAFLDDDIQRTVIGLRRGGR